MRRCEKMRRCFSDPHYWKNPALRRSREQVVLNVVDDKFTIVPHEATAEVSKIGHYRRGGLL